MSSDGLAGELLFGGNAGAERAPLAVAATLAICDRLLGEIGRRRHVFAWLRMPDAGADEWLPVDAYYPRNRVIVVCGETPAELDRLYAELTPAHGLRLLRLPPSEIGTDPETARLAVERLVAALGPPPQQVAEPAPSSWTIAPAGESPVARALASLAQAPRPPTFERRPMGQAQAAAAARAARFVAARESARASDPAERPVGRRPAQQRPPAPELALREPVIRAQAPPAQTSRKPPGPRTRAAADRRRGGEIQALGVMLGLALAAVVCLEVYVGVVFVAIQGGHAALGFGVALDACSRALGTIAAGRAGREGWAWGCLIGGSPVVAVFALFRRSGPVSTEPAPLAGLIALLALVVAAIALVAGALGA